MNTDRASAFVLTASAALMALATVLVCSTTNPATAPKGTALAIVLGGAVLPGACCIGASQFMD
jgi:hypothetical protein